MRTIGRLSVLVGIAVLAQGLVAAPGLATFPGNGTTIAFVRGNNIWVGSISSGTAHPITHFTSSGAHDPAWSPDGKRLAFDRGGYVWISKADGTHQRRLTAGVQPSWSHRGDRIAYTVPSGRSTYCPDSVHPAKEFTKFELKIISTRGGSPTTLTRITSKYDRDCYMSRIDSKMQWSSDDKTISYTVFGAFNGGDVNSKLNEINVTNHHITLRGDWSCYGEGCDPQFPLADINLSPDGAFFLASCDESRLCLISHDGTKSLMASRQPQLVQDPVWSPDASAYVYTLRSPQQADLMWQKVSGGGAVKVFSNALEADWRP